MIFDPARERKSSMSREKYSKRVAAFIIPYCLRCAETLAMPIGNISGAEECGFCGKLDTIRGRIGRDMVDQDTLFGGPKSPALEKKVNGYPGECRYATKFGPDWWCDKAKDKPCVVDEGRYCAEEERRPTNEGERVYGRYY